MRLTQEGRRYKERPSRMAGPRHPRGEGRALRSKTNCTESFLEGPGRAGREGRIDSDGDDWKPHGALADAADRQGAEAVMTLWIAGCPSPDIIAKE